MEYQSPREVSSPKALVRLVQGHIQVIQVRDDRVGALGPDGRLGGVVVFGKVG
jgi:hypothetical protein